MESRHITSAAPAPPAQAGASFVIDPREAICSRFDGVHHHRAGESPGESPLNLSVALPASYARARRRRYALIILFDAAGMFGSAIEISRALAATREAGECILVAVDCPPGRQPGDLIDEILAWAHRGLRTQRDRVALFACGDSGAALLRLAHNGMKGIAGCIVGALPPEAIAAGTPRPAAGGPFIAWTEAAMPQGAATSIDNIRWNPLPECTQAALAVPAFVHGLRVLCGSGHAYGSEALPLRKPWVGKTLRALAPLARRVWPRPGFPASAPQRYLIRSQLMARDFEVFASLPASSHAEPARRYPALLALDANGSFCIAAETAARLAQAGDIEELIVIGIGTPRAEGIVEFAFRRFEELSAPLDGYAFDDDLGRVFSALYALRGQDARRQLGQAPLFQRFLSEELLPLLLAQLPVDAGELGLLGHSAAGAFAGYSIAQADSPFKAYAALSPGTAISGSWMMKQGPACGPAASDARIYLSIGAEENHNVFNRISGIPDTVDYAAQLRANSRAAVDFHTLAGETHTTVMPRALAHALLTLYPRQQQQQ